MKKSTIDILKCNQCGKCLFDCPLYEHYRDQVYSPRGKAVAVIHNIRDKRLLICNFCGKCLKQCPLNIDIPGYFLLKYWPKDFYGLNTEGDVLLSGKGILWKRSVTFNAISKDIKILSLKKRISTDSPFYLLFLKKLITYNDIKCSIEFIHSKKTKGLPFFMKGHLEKGERFKDLYFYMDPENTESTHEL